MMKAPIAPPKMIINSYGNALRMMANLPPASV